MEIIINFSWVKRLPSGEDNSLEMSSLEQHLQQLGNGHTAPQRSSGQGTNIYVVYIRTRVYCTHMNEGNGGTCVHAHTHKHKRGRLVVRRKSEREIDFYFLYWLARLL